MPKVKKRIHQPYEEARQRILLTGTKIMKLRCPFCAWLRTLSDENNITEFYPVYDYEQPLLVGCMAGRGGIFKSADLSSNIEALKGKPEWKPLLDEIREKAKEILEQLGPGDEE